MRYKWIDTHADRSEGTMTEPTTTCSHGLDKAFRGMRTIALSIDTVTFECPTCGAQQIALRCAGITKSGERCRVAATNGATACFRHRRNVAVAEVAR
ncbi:MAG: hypothetical protein C0498_01665 [Anaerolinea sp.]|nr:hypothetical protein [Anaerolinea sp.]